MKIKIKGTIKSRQPTVAAVPVTTDPQRSALRVVDAMDELDCQLKAYRAVESLAINECIGSEESLSQLNRSDLAMLLSVLNTNLEAHCAKAREAAVLSAKGE